jgi:hypothetical protein
MFAFLRTAIFPPSDQNWTWRRRMAFSGCAVALFGIVHAIRFEPDKAWAAIVLIQCIAFWGITMGIYYKGSDASEKNAATTNTVTATRQPDGTATVTTETKP